MKAGDYAENDSFVTGQKRGHFISFLSFLFFEGKKKSVVDCCRAHCLMVTCKSWMKRVHGTKQEDLASASLSTLEPLSLSPLLLSSPSLTPLHYNPFLWLSLCLCHSRHGRLSFLPCLSDVVPATLPDLTGPPSPVPSLEFRFRSVNRFLHCALERKSSCVLGPFSKYMKTYGVENTMCKNKWGARTNFLVRLVGDLIPFCLHSV